MIPIKNLESLPLFHRATIPKTYLDAMGHMNIRWYMALFDEAIWEMFASFGMNLDFFQTEKAGAFALQQFVRYLAEVRTGEMVAIRARILGRSAKRLHFMLFMINETSGSLATTLEGLGSYADLTVRRTKPFPDRIAGRIDALLAEHSRLGWYAPICGVIKP